MEDKSLVSLLRRGLEAELYPDGVTPEQIIILESVERTLSKAFKAGYKMAQAFNSEEWSNNACLGYVAIGAKRLGYTEDQITEIVRSTSRQFDFKTLGEAIQFYESSPY